MNIIFPASSSEKACSAFSIALSTHIIHRHRKVPSRWEKEVQKQEKQENKDSKESKTVTNYYNNVFTDNLGGYSTCSRACAMKKNKIIRIMPSTVSLSLESYYRIRNNAF